MTSKRLKRDLPVELLRTFVELNKAGHLDDAARTLGLHPALVRDHIASLEHALGSPIFERFDRGVVHLSDYGKIVSTYAERAVSINDQLIDLSAMRPSTERVRIGLPRWVVENILLEIAERCEDGIGAGKVALRCDSLEELVRELTAGMLDVALLCSMTDAAGVMATEWSEEMHWVRSPRLPLERNKPIPIVSWPGSMSDRLVTKALRRAGLEFVITFTAAEMSSRLTAVAAGLGVMAASERALGTHVRKAPEPFLPALPPSKKGIYLRKGLPARRAEPVIAILEHCVRPASAHATTALIRDDDETLDA